MRAPDADVKAVQRAERELGRAPMPKQDKSKSRQDYETPPSFITAVAQRFGPLFYDLAATAANAKARNFITPERDAFTVNWARELGEGLGWLNSPFANLRPWVQKCRDEMAIGARILQLTPASVGSEWFGDLVYGCAGVQVLYVAPRITFVGETTPYPKDILLLVWDRRFEHATGRWNFTEQAVRFDECRRDFDYAARGDAVGEPG